MPTSSRLLTLLAAFAMLAVASASPARAQFQTADPVEQARLLLSENRADVARGRRELLTLLTAPALSGADRARLAADIAPILREAIARDSDFAALNAVLVAGGLAANESVDLISAALSDSRLPVRLAAATAAAWFFDQVRAHPPAAFPDRAARLLGRLGETIRTEPRHEVLDAAIRAVAHAWRVDRSSFADDLRDPALTLLAASIRDRLRSVPDEPQPREFLAALVRAADLLQTAIRDDLNRLFSDDAVRNATRDFSAAVFEYLASRIGSGSLFEASAGSAALRREAMAQLLGSTQNLVFIAFQRLTGRTPEITAPDPARLRAAAEVRDDVKFAEDLRRFYTADAGMLRRAPFTP